MRRAAVTALFPIIAAVTSNAELLTNPSFETPSAGVWTRYFAGQSIGGWEVEDIGVTHVGTSAMPAAHDGEQLLLLSIEEGNGVGGVHQDVVSQPGVAYRLTFAMAGPVTGGPDVKTLDLFWEDQFVQTFAWDRSKQGTNWVVHELDLPATHDGSRLRFFGTVQGGGGAYIDAVSLVPIPEPASLVAWLAGGCWIIAGRRRACTFVRGPKRSLPDGALSRADS